MRESPTEYLVDGIREALVWAPGWVSSVAIMVAFAAIALLVHRTVLRLIARFFKPGSKFGPRVLERSHGPARAALVIIALSIALPPAGFSPAVTGMIAQILLVGFILLVGWVAATAADTGAAIYLRGFKLDVDDNLLARKHVTQVRVLKRAVDVLIIILTASIALMTFAPVREYGVSLLASAGAAGLVVGFAAKPVLANLIAGIQIAVTQPIRIEDAVVVEGEWGWVEDITGTYVVIRIWDWRRLIVPLSYFTENSFQNWTRESASIIGTVFVHVDYRAPVDRIREKVEEIARASPRWDGKVVNVQVTEAGAATLELRILVSGRNSPVTWDLRCEVREKIVAFLQAEMPEALPRVRAEVGGAAAGSTVPIGDGGRRWFGRRTPPSAAVMAAQENA